MLVKDLRKACGNVNYVIDTHGQNRKYRYAMVVRKNKYIHLFYNREKRDLLQFERTKEGLQLYPIYFGEDFILCTPEGGLPLDDIFPEKLWNEEQRRIIQSHSEESCGNALLWICKYLTHKSLSIINKKGANESSNSIGKPKFLLCKLNSFFP